MRHVQRLLSVLHLLSIFLSCLLLSPLLTFPVFPLLVALPLLSLLAGGLALYFGL